MVDISSGADFVQVLVGVFKERHQADLARIVIFCFMRMALFVPLSESQFGQFQCFFSFFVPLFVESLSIVVLDLDSSLLVFFYLKVQHLLHEQLCMCFNLTIHRYRLNLVASLLL